MYPDYPHDGTVDEVLSWVDGDPDRASDALAYERAGKGRKTLLSALGDLLEPPAGEDEGAGQPGVSPDASPVGSKTNGGPVYVARKRMHVPGKVYMPGDVVVEAPTWKRVEGYVRTGYLEVRDE